MLEIPLHASRKSYQNFSPNLNAIASGQNVLNSGELHPVEVGEQIRMNCTQ